MGIDLHIHSDASDGTFSVAQLLETAENLKLRAISITDHDTLVGCETAFRIGIPASLNFVSGVEISAGSPPDYPCFGSLHILGYGVRRDDPILNSKLSVLRDARKNRNPQMLRKLQDLGIEISMSELENRFKDAQIGRPHIAKLMMEKGYVRSIDEAFDKYIGRRGPAYVEKYRLPCDETIAAIRNSGGVAVLAHPILVRALDPTDPIEKLIVVLKDMGLEGLEVYYPEQYPNYISYYADMSNHFGLMMTGGTDFHGAIKPDIRMGTAKGNFSVPDEIYDNLALKLGY